MEGFLIFIAIVFGILSLILFFKVWGMCNNVKQLKDHHLKPTEDFNAKFDFLIKIGEKEKAKDILFEHIFSQEFFSNTEWKSSSKVTKSIKDFKEKLNQVGIIIE